MSFKVKTKKPGDIIRSEDWNEAMEEIGRLESTKLSLEGGRIIGPLSISNAKEPKNGSPLRFETHKESALVSIGDTNAISIAENGGIGIGMENPYVGLAVAGPVVRKVWVSTGLGPIDGRDSGLIDGRVLNFTKYHENSAVRIMYSDCLRVLGISSKNGAGRWEILIDNAPPPGGRIFQDLYAWTGGESNHHRPSSIIGYAQGLAIGQHTITINVGDVEGDAGYKDRYTGWNASRWTIEAEEVWIQE